MSLITTEEVEARFATGLDTDTLQEVIDQQESWLTRKIGQLTGERTLTMHPDPIGPIYLPRPCDDCTVQVNGDDLDASRFRLTGTTLEYLSGTVPVPWWGTIAVTFTPNDESEVKDALMQLVHLTVTSAPFMSEQGDGRSATRFTTYNRQRSMIARTVRANRGPMAVPMPYLS